MGLIQDIIDKNPEKIKERSTKKQARKEARKQIKNKTNKLLRKADETIKKSRTIRTADKISKTKIKFRKGRISKGFKINI